MNMSHGIIILIFLIFGAVFANMHMSVLKQNENLISKNTHLNVGVDEHGPMDLLHIDGDHSMKGCLADGENAQRGVEKGRGIGRLRVTRGTTGTVLRRSDCPPCLSSYRLPYGAASLLADMNYRSSGLLASLIVMLGTVCT
jgi:hypothetical protein